MFHSLNIKVGFVRFYLNKRKLTVFLSAELPEGTVLSEPQQTGLPPHRKRLHWQNTRFDFNLRLNSRILIQCRSSSTLPSTSVNTVIWQSVCQQATCRHLTWTFKIKALPAVGTAQSVTEFPLWIWATVCHQHAHQFQFSMKHCFTFHTQSCMNCFMV